jgi:hypothetical protein
VNDQIHGEDRYPDPPEPKGDHPDLVRYEVDCLAPFDLVRGSVNRALIEYSKEHDPESEERDQYGPNIASIFSGHYHIDQGDLGEMGLQLRPLSAHRTTCTFWAWGDYRSLLPILEKYLMPFQDRAAQVKRLRDQGLTLKEIAARLNISLATVKRDLKSLSQN